MPCTWIWSSWTRSQDRGSFPRPGRRTTAKTPVSALNLVALGQGLGELSSVRGKTAAGMRQGNRTARQAGRELVIGWVTAQAGWHSLLGGIWQLSCLVETPPGCWGRRPTGG